MSTTVERLRANLASVYGSATAEEILEKLLPRMNRCAPCALPEKAPTPPWILPIQCHCAPCPINGK